MEYTEYYLLAAYAVVAGLHLLFCATGTNAGKTITKVLLMPMLLCYYLLATWSVYPLAIAAILLGWSGDILLLWPKKRICFLSGLGCFLLGHICYSAMMGCWIGNLLTILPGVLISGVVLGGVGYAAYRTLAGSIAGMRAAVIAYLVVILLMTWIAFWSLLTDQGCSGKLLFAGGVCFVISDYILARETFLRQHRWGDFAVMSTYVAAQFFLVCGLTLI